MDEKQFDVFWNITCPKCKEKIDLEILINTIGLRKQE